MEIVLPPDFLSITKGKFILLDTCVFIDAFSKPKKFGEFFNDLKANNVTLVTIPEVLNEFLKGSPDEAKFNSKKDYVFSIIETLLPDSDIQKNIESLIKSYGLESKDLSISDLSLGATLMKYSKRLFLMSRDISDFPTTIFKRDTMLNITSHKTIHTYGFYSYV